MKKVLLLLTILTFCAFNAISQERIETEEYSVYKALLEQWFIKPETKAVAIFNLTLSIKPHAFLYQGLSSVKPELVTNYYERNRNSFELRDNFGVQPTVNLVTEDDLHSIYDKSQGETFGDNSKRVFEERYSTTILFILSRVGFNKNKNKALVEFNFNNGICGTCSETYFVVLSKEMGRWIIKKKLLTYVT